jgi:HEAT repeat protein
MKSLPAPWQADRRSSQELIALALAETPAEHKRWDFVDTLGMRGGEPEFRLAAQLIESPNPDERCLGARILAQLGGGTPAYVTESVDRLLPMLRAQESAVLASVASALGHRRDHRAIGPLAQLADHPEADVRFAVACALGNFEDDIAINALIQLSADADDDVRNWATFGLGSLRDADRPEIRAALFVRTREDNGEIRGEALVGLALRQDERVLDLVRAELQGEYAGSWVLEAAELVGDASLVPLLEALRSGWGEDNESSFGDHLNQAIAACGARHVALETPTEALS